MIEARVAAWFVGMAWLDTRLACNHGIAALERQHSAYSFYGVSVSAGVNWVLYTRERTI